MNNNYYIKLFKILIYLLALNNFAFCQVHNKLNSFIKNDTLLLPDIPISNTGDIFSNIECLSMIDNNFEMDGYLIIQLDTNSYLNLFKDSSLVLKTQIFWLKRLESIFDDSSYYYYDPPLGRESIGFSRYVNDSARDDISTFLYYISIYNRTNRTFLKKQYLTYLYFTNNLLRTLYIDKAVIWERKDNPNLKYIFFKTRFIAALIYDSRSKRKILFPSSWLYDFYLFDAKTEEDLRSDNLPKFINNNFKLSSLKIKVN
jgi:hypothetical protein